MPPARCELGLNTGLLNRVQVFSAKVSSGARGSSPPTPSPRISCHIYKRSASINRCTVPFDTRRGRRNNKDNPRNFSRGKKLEEEGFGYRNRLSKRWSRLAQARFEDPTRDLFSYRVTYHVFNRPDDDDSLEIVILGGDDRLPKRSRKSTTWLIRPLRADDRIIVIGSDWVEGEMEY